MNVSKLHVLVIKLCGFFAMIHAMDDRAIVPVRASSDRTVLVPLSVIREYLTRIPFFALEHETIFVRNYLRTQKRIPKVNNILVDAVDEKKALVCYVPQGINRRVVHDRDDDSNIHIDFEPQEDVFFTQEHFERISRMPEGPTLCFCNILFGGAMLGLVLILTFCK